ncbi:MAG: patatin-like phospholipase family protein [Candidatus Mcinerneyibacterium aminivorans]|uniref:Patatin-like phospholipase family protein n=1 Tax=Candidatus Mcinerneyibacterium aminivorans TaxID=2703815 RepID=A0A5D0MJR8_9BACT|nr:MAG: patatin-like phospholipase family protein [Candidatus Mcinerneyibacterium aminivorans]
MNKIALVLSGGGAKGFAHIGVLKALEEHDISPDIIVGTSMGAIIGGFYSSGVSLKDIEEIASTFDWKEFAKILVLPTSETGIIKGDKIVKFFRNIIGYTKIEDLSTKFSAVAFDLKNNCETIIDGGDLVSALRASMAIPMIFSPFIYKGRVLFDGGLINPLPIDVAKEYNPNTIIAVNVMKKKIKNFSRERIGINLDYYKDKNKKKKRKFKKKLDSNFLLKQVKNDSQKNIIKEKIFKLYDFFDDYFDKNNEDKPLSKMDILENIFYITQNYFIESKAGENNRDVDIYYEPIFDTVNFFDFSRAKYLIDKAEKEMKKILDDKNIK